jgi:hypothetical protein
MNWRTGWPFVTGEGAVGRATMPPVVGVAAGVRAARKTPRQATTWSPTLTLVTSAPCLDDPGALVAKTIGRSSGNRVDDMQIAAAGRSRQCAQDLAAPWLVVSTASIVGGSAPCGGSLYFHGVLSIDADLPATTERRDAS